VALENIRILKEEAIVERVATDTGPYLQRRLKELEAHPLVGEVRGLGFLAAIELVKDKTRRQFFDPIGEVGMICRDHCFANGIVMRATRDTMLLSPPLVMTRGDIDELVEVAKKCLDLTARDVARR
jgi:putrescine aminotransferase